MKNSFRKRVKRQPKRLQWQCLVHRSCFEKEIFSNMYTYIYTFIHMWKALFWEIIIKLGIGIANPYFRMALNAFWKRVLQIYLYAYILIHNAKWWPNFRVLLISVSLSFRTPNVHQRTARILHPIWLVNSMIGFYVLTFRTNTFHSNLNGFDSLWSFCPEWHPFLAN